MNNYVLVTMDSCRYDAVEAVWNQLQVLPAIGPLQEAFTFTTWTQPAHMNFMTGRLPWIPRQPNNKPFHTGEYHRHELHEDLRRWNERLGCHVGSILDEGFRIETRLRQLGYKLHAIVAARPLGIGSHFAHLFDKHRYVGGYGDTLLRAIEHLDFTAQPVFLVLNLCETHYPYYDGSYDEHYEKRWVSGLGGQARAAAKGDVLAKPVFTVNELRELRLRQQRAVCYVDSLLPRLLEHLPQNTFLTITADHGECFGESGQFGHGEVTDPLKGCH